MIYTNYRFDAGLDDGDFGVADLFELRRTPYLATLLIDVDPIIISNIAKQTEADMPNKVICHYRVTKGNESKFEELLHKHWPALRRLGLVTEDPPQHFRGEEQDNGQPIYFEIFDWLDGAVDRAHEHPEVMAIWEPMDQLCEARGVKPNMEFPHVQIL